MATRTIKSITPERLAALNSGQAEVANLVEGLAINIPMLIQTVFPQALIDPAISQLGITARMQHYAASLYEQYGFTAFDTLKNQRSDTLRGIACYFPALHGQSITQQLAAIQPLADDAHFGVREWAWMAVRPTVATNLKEALIILPMWTKHASENIRRFAIEILRPRGVWCSHLHALRQEPWRAEHLLELVKNDPAKYVQLSAGNWLNDASKDQPAWTLNLCEQWQEEPGYSAATQKIIARGLRTLKKMAQAAQSAT